MKYFKSILLVLALVVAGTVTGTTASAAVLADGNARVQLTFLETSDGTWAFVRVQARYRLLLLGDVTIVRNGDVLKVDPVTTSDQVLVTAYLGPTGKDYAVCASFEGQTYLGGDNFRPAAAKTCGFRGPSVPVAPGARFGGRSPHLAGLRAGEFGLRDF